MSHMSRRHARMAATCVALATPLLFAGTASRVAGDESQDPAAAYASTTPIKHLVVIFQENVSFDHYFGTYPNAANPSGEPAFTARPDTPRVNGLSDALLQHNPNLANPQRLDRSEAVTCDQNHGYTAEQDAVDHGLMDQVVQSTGATAGSPGHPQTLGECLGGAPTPGNYAVMDYYDGNTTTALWNYAQHFAMSDNSFGTGYGPSTPGAFNVVAGNSAGAVCGPSTSTYGASPCPAGVGTATPGVDAAQGPGTVVGDPDPYYDVCSAPHRSDGIVAMGGRNIGDQLTAHGLTWGWFQGGFGSPGYVPGNASTYNQSTVCTGAHAAVNGASTTDYSAHHEPFQYWPQTANPRHLPPSSIAAIGHQDQANHQYDLADFWAAVHAHGLPAVSFLKAAKYQDGHAGYSDPLDEQTFLVRTINALQQTPEWHSTAVVIAYDDSDGWYDHVVGPVLFQSQTSLDTLSAPGQCGADSSKVPVGDGGMVQQARCGYGPRLPLLVISPFARRNAVDHSFTDQSSVVRLIEDNWSLSHVGGGSADALAGSLLGMLDFSGGDAGRLILDPSTGQPVNDHSQS